jgi:adenosine/AMP kinase
LVELETVPITPKDYNLIVGQAHFIKTVEDLYEAMVSSSPSTKFGVAFCESSGPALIRADGNDEGLKAEAVRIAGALGAGHSFVIVLRDAFPVNVLNRVKGVDEVVSVFCATANPVQFIIGRTEQGRGILGVVDGVSPRGVEGAIEREERRDFLRKIGYKR